MTPNIFERLNINLFAIAIGGYCLIRLAVEGLRVAFRKGAPKCV